MLDCRALIIGSLPGSSAHSSVDQRVEDLVLELDQSDAKIKEQQVIGTCDCAISYIVLVENFFHSQTLFLRNVDSV